MLSSTSPRSKGLYEFQHPNVKLRLALGRKRKSWYLVLARNYGSGQPREVVRLDKAGMRSSSDGSHSRFWFNTKATSGWERNGQSLLQLLLSLDPYDPPVIALASGDTVLEEKCGALEVDVIVPAHRLARWCEGCGYWETVDSNPRWILARPGKMPGYLCGACAEKDWFGARVLRYLHIRRGRSML
ncbi:hypothetical protein BDN72DRAFT_671332 [Pluteus cervinus]|uniref:Uncharacterized protein n=1 Tax=Pluteus cervinus TaxID=181527 RepID=A0ACD3BAP9_9AGAR|nr:hypothetical protein BDN72DRAFT_671332 [Pluteus cervinus]